LVDHCKICLVPRSSYLTLSNTVTLKSHSRSLKFETGTSRKLACNLLFPLYSILCRLWDIATYWLKSQNFYAPPLLSVPQGSDSVGITRRCLIFIKLEWLGTVRWRNYDHNMLSRFHKILERDGQTDRRTDGGTELLYQYQYRVSVLTRDKNGFFRPISHYISEIIQDRAVVTMECE